MKAIDYHFCLVGLEWGSGGVVITLSFLCTLFRRKTGPVVLDPLPVTSLMSEAV